ncbi:unnamed protein product [Lampetra planeri]
MEAAAVPSHTRLPPIPASRKMKPRAPVPPLMRSQSETGPPNLDPPDHGGGDGLSVENVELNVILPGGEHHMARVDGSKPVMDLLIVLCGRYRLSPGGHTLELLSRDNASPLQYKPNTPLGALCAGTALLKPRAASEDRLKKPMQPVVPEQTVRLMVNYLRTQKTMVRVSPRVALQALLPEICNKCEFNVPHTTLFRDASETELLDMSCSLSELGIKEVYAVDRSKELSHGLNDNTDLPEKENKGLLSFLRPKKKKETRRTQSPPAPLASSSTEAAGATSPLAMLQHRTKRRAPPPPPSTTAQGMQVSAESPPSPPPRSAPEQASAALLQPGSPPPVQPSAENQHRRRSSSTEPALPDSTVIKATADSSSNNTDKVDINNETKYPVLSANANVATDVKRGPSKKALQFLKAYNDMQKREAADKNKAGNVQQVSDKPPVTQKKDGNEVKVDFLAKVQKSALAQQRDHKSKPTLCGSFSGATAKASGCVVGEQDPRHKRLSMAFPDISTKPNSELSRAERHGGSLKCLDKMPVKNETFLNAHVEKIPVVHAKSVDKQVKSITAERQNASSEQYKKQLVTQKYMTYVEESVMIQPVEIHKEIAGAREEIVEPDKVFKVIAEERLSKPSEKKFLSESIQSGKVSEINKTSQPIMGQSNEPEASMQNSIFYKTRSISREPCAPEVEYQYNSAEPSSPVLPVYKQPSDRWRSTNEITRDYLPKVGLTTYRIVPSKPVIRPKPETADVPFLLPTYETEASKTENSTATDTTKEIKEKLQYDSTAKIRDITANPQQHTAHQSPVISPPLIPPPLIPPPLIPPLSGLSNVTRPFQRSHSLQCTPETISQQHSAVKATEPLASIATSPPSSSKQDAFFRPGRRTSSLYVASAIAKKTAYKSIDTPNETYSGTTTTKTTPVDALPPLQVNCEQDELIIPPPPQFSTEENANIPNAPGDPGKVIIIEAPRVHQWKPKLFRPVSFPSVIFKDDKPSSMSVESSHLESKNTIFAVKSPPPVISQPSSGYPFNVKSASNSSQIQSVLSSPKSTDASPFYQPPTVLNTTGAALESPSLIYEQRKPSVRPRLASVHSPPVPIAPPPVILMGNGARSTECSPEEARLAMLDAIRSGSCAGMLKKVPTSVKTIEVNGKSGTIRSSSS